MPATRLSNLLERLSSKLSSPEEDEWLPTTPTSTVMDDMPLVEHGANMTTRKRRKPLLHRFFGRRTALEVSYGSASYVYHGEDAMAITSYFHIVADGVSAGNDGNQDFMSPSAILAKALVNAIEKCLVQYEALVSQVPNSASISSFQERILHAIASVQANLTFEENMASTLVVCYIDRRTRTLYTFCIGDSKSIVVRKDKVIYETFAVLKEFNVPAVINAKPVSRFMVQSIQLQPGDRLVSFSDGIGDNLFKDQLVSMLATSCRKPLSSAKSKIFAQSQELPSSICSNLAHAALDNQSKDWQDYPFSVAAAKEYVTRIQRNGGSAMEKTKAHELKTALKETKATFDRSVSACNPNGYTNHYLISQVERMASLTHKKPDDISICLSVFT